MKSPPLFFHGFPRTHTEMTQKLGETLALLADVRSRAGNIAWLDVEPLSWDLASALGRDHPLDWIVVGAQTDGRKYIPPHPQHLKNLSELTDQTRTPIFYKDTMEVILGRKDSTGRYVCPRWHQDLPTHYLYSAGLLRFRKLSHREDYR